MVEKVSTVPDCFKQVVRLVLRNFDQLEDALIMDLLIRYQCLSEKQLKDLLRFDSKMIRARLNHLKIRKYIQMRTRMEKGPVGQGDQEAHEKTKVHYYYIHYINFMNAVRYKIMMILKKLENSEKAHREQQYLWCIKCPKTFTITEIGECYDDDRGDYFCTFCKSPAEERYATHRKKDTASQKKKFNQEISVILFLIDECKKYTLSTISMIPVPFKYLDGTVANRSVTRVGHVSAKNSESSGKGKRHGEQIHVEINMHEETSNKFLPVSKEMPEWFT